MSHENHAVSKSLGKIAASVFCDKVAADAVTEAEKLCKENKILEPISKELLTFKLFGATEDDIVCYIVLDISLYDGEDNDFYVYKISNTPSFPHENIGRLVTVLSGVRSIRNIFLSPLLRIEDDDTVFIKFPLIEDVLFFEGKLENCRGSLDEIEYDVVTNRSRLYFSGLGSIVEGTGLPPDSHGAENTFFGSTVKLETIKILKKIVDRAIKTETLPTKDQNDVAANLKKLSLAFPDNDNIQQATQKYAWNKLRNDQLVLRRHISQTIEGRNPNGSVFQFQLNEGSIGTIMKDREPIPSCNLWPTSCEKATVPLSSLVDLSIFLGNSPISGLEQTFTTRGLEHIRGTDGFVLVYSGHVVVEAVFGRQHRRICRRPRSSPAHLVHR